MGPRVDVDSPLPSQVPHQLAVHDAEVEAELVPHLVPPLDLERGRAEDQDPAGTVPEDQFEGDHPGLDGLAQANVVGDQQVDPRHLDRPDHGVKLVVLDVDARSERRLDVLHVGGGCGTPADGIEKGVEPVGFVEAAGLGQVDFLQLPGSRLQLPENLEFLAEGVILDRRKRDEVLPRGRARFQRRRSKRTRFDAIDDPMAGSDTDQLPLFGGRNQANVHRRFQRVGANG